MIRITSTVFKARLSLDSHWIASTAATDPDALPADRYVLGTVGYAPTFPTALALAAQQRADLDAELMDDVHASRATRRIPTEAPC